MNDTQFSVAGSVLAEWQARSDATRAWTVESARVLLRSRGRVAAAMGWWKSGEDYGRRYFWSRLLGLSGRVRTILPDRMRRRIRRFTAPEMRLWPILLAISARLRGPFERALNKSDAGPDSSCDSSRDSGCDLWLRLWPGLLLHHFQGSRMHGQPDHYGRRVPALV